MSILAVIGTTSTCLLAFFLVIGGLLNIGGCGDRTGNDYKVSNYIQIALGLFLAILVFKLQ